MNQLCLRSLRLSWHQKACHPVLFRRGLANIAPKAPRTSQPLPDSMATSSPRQSLPAGKLQFNISPEQMRKQFRADKIFENGTKEIYKAPSHVGLLISTYLVAGSCFSVALGLFWTGHWTHDTESELPWFVPVAWRLGMMLFTTAGGLAIIRTMRFITALELVKQNGLIKLRVTVRRVVPFLKPKQHCVAPWEFKIDRVTDQLEGPAWLSSDTASKSGFGFGIARAVSKLFYSAFVSFRRLFVHDGIGKVTIDKSANWARLDFNGKFSNGGNDLFEIVTIER